jgi:hypothetical protein
MKHNDDHRLINKKLENNKCCLFKDDSTIPTHVLRNIKTTKYPSHNSPQPAQGSN